MKMKAGSWLFGASLYVALASTVSCSQVADPPPTHDSEPLAQARQELVTYEINTDDENCDWILYNGNEVWGCTVTTTVGPTGWSTPAVDWGVCGFLSMQSNPDAGTVIRIIVDEDGYYALLVAVGNPDEHFAKATVGCVPMGTFDGVPDLTDATPTSAWGLNSLSGPQALTMRLYDAPFTSSRSMCRWAGFDGDIAVADASKFERLYAGTHLVDNEDLGWHLDTAMSFTPVPDYSTYAFCDGWIPNHTWKYFTEGTTVTGFNAFYTFVDSGGEYLPVVGADAYCWIAGLEPVSDNFDVNLEVRTPSPPGAPSWWYRTTNIFTAIGIQCVDYDQ